MKKTKCMGGEGGGGVQHTTPVEVQTREYFISPQIHY